MSLANSDAGSQDNDSTGRAVVTGTDTDFACVTLEVVTDIAICTFFSIVNDAIAFSVSNSVAASTARW